MQHESDRLLLRPWISDDAQDLFEYASDPQIGPPAGWPPHENEDQSLEIIKTVFSGEETYAICLKADNKAIGCVGLKLKGETELSDRNDECELGYWIGRAFWGQGLVPEAGELLLRHAFLDLGMRAVWCSYYDGNHKSRRVMEKLGFEYAYKRQNIEVELLGETRTAHVMLLDKAHWEIRNIQQPTAK